MTHAASLLRQTLALFLVMGSLSCERAAPAPGAAAQPGPVADAPAAKPRAKPLPAAAAPLRATMSRALEARALLSASPARFREGFVGQQGDFARLLKGAYELREGRLVFHAEGRPLPNIDPLLAVLRRLPDEALPLEPYALDRLEALVALQSSLLDAEAAARECQGYEDSQLVLCQIVLGAESTPTPEEAARLLAERGLGALDPRLVAWADEAVAAHVDTVAALQQAQTELDVLLLRAFFQYVADFRLIRRAHPDVQTPRPEEIASRKRQTLLDHLASAGEDLAGHLQGQRPANPIYERTIAALVHYRRLAEEGGFEKLPLTRLRKGRKGPEVKALKHRLAMENYFNGTHDERFDAELEAAVEAYQERRSLLVDGQCGKALIQSLNLPIERRIRTIELSLQRWRESEIPHGLPLYARVNVPQFEVELWEGDDTARVHRVIVGSNAMDRNLLAGTEGRLNHTRLFQAEMSSIVLNPTWSVPIRIKEYELDRELMENPQYYEDNRFEIVKLADGRTLVKQGPGPTNALGEVKFLFPNEHAIYMHDTPKRHLFDRVYRAFSHGCIRTHRPVALARWLLERQSGVSGDEVDAILRTRRERALALRETVPIFIEYNTVSVDTEGRVAFYDDIYRYDRAYWAGELPIQHARKIEAERLTTLRDEEANWRAELAAQLEDSDVPPDEATADDGTGE